MAVYTHLSASEIEDLIAQYDIGKLVSAKGIAEGVSNSNWLIETTGSNGSGARFILTVYEERTDISELPFFLDLLDHLSAKGCPVPKTIHDKGGNSYRMVRGNKAAALIEFLPGVSIDKPDAAQARAVGRALASIHLATQDFPYSRPNALALPGWRNLLADCDPAGLAAIDSSLPQLIRSKLGELEGIWPTSLPGAVIHADLFPDNVLMLGHEVAGLIDFYFACNDSAAFDLAVTHAAWCFNADGTIFNPDIGAALIAGYEELRPLSDTEREALPVLSQGAAMRFIATRAYDWLNTPAEALVTRKDPMDFVNRLNFYSEAAPEIFLL